MEDSALLYYFLERFLHANHVTNHKGPPQGKQTALGTDPCQNGSIFCKNRCPLQPAPLAQTHGMHKDALLGSFELGRPGKNFRARRGAVYHVLTIYFRYYEHAHGSSNNEWRKF